MSFTRTRYMARQYPGLFLQAPSYAQSKLQRTRPAAHFKGLPTRVHMPPVKSFPLTLSIIATGVLMGFLLTKVGLNAYLPEQEAEFKSANDASKVIDRSVSEGVNVEKHNQQTATPSYVKMEQEQEKYAMTM